jgi:DNA mismatch repair protein MutL
MSRIRIMSDALASQVAAGEVVERPAAVVRELVENSIDAGATHVEVLVQRGGAALIRVTDNGSGMDREDVLMCLERHATSKIHAKEDLAAIRTLGFRGEALPSIASVSRFRLASREPEALSGTEVEINGGRMAAVRDYGGAPGTVVEARSLFYNVPARRKFLRSEQTEFAHVEQQFKLHAIANPGVAFTLIKDGEVAFHLPATSVLLDRIAGLSGRDLAQRLITLPDSDHLDIRVHGYIGSAGISRPNKQLTHTFLNTRPVDSSTLSYALREGYHTALMKGQYPITFLFIEMQPDAFDINVHPAKKEVRFHNSNQVREAVSRAVSSALGASTQISGGHVPASGGFAKPSPMEQTPELIPEQEQTALRRDWSTLPVTGDMRPQSPPISIETGSATSPPSQAVASDASATMDAGEIPATTGTQPSFSGKPQFRILGVLDKLYVLMEGSEGLVLMDQHAAHERVLFEQMRRAMENEGVISQRLLIPLTLQVAPRDYDLLGRNLVTLAKLGIEAEPFGGNSLKVDALPAFLKTDDPLALLRDVIDELSSASSKTSALRLGEDMIATTVCRHAVKANDFLRIPELQKLLDDLFVCEMPYCCPHGRPTLIQISFAELERKFGRRAP